MWYDGFIFGGFAAIHLMTFMGMRSMLMERFKTGLEGTVAWLFLAIFLAVCYQGWHWMGWVN